MWIYCVGYFDKAEEFFKIKLEWKSNEKKIELLWTDISCLGGVFVEKYQSRDGKFHEPKGEENLVLRLVFFANTPPDMIYLFNYTEYYLKHWLNK